jgi:hypothetical protein
VPILVLTSYVLYFVMLSQAVESLEEDQGFDSHRFWQEVVILFLFRHLTFHELICEEH